MDPHAQTAVHLYQIVYNAATREALEPGYLMLDNLANDRPDWYEYWPIRRFLLDATQGRASPLDESAWYGFFSPEFGSKTQLSHAQVQAYVRQHDTGADVVLWDLMSWNKHTYGDFLKSAEGIATNILASRLQSLEENRLIEKLEHPDSKAKNLYKLTQKGMDLIPIIVEMYLWSEKYLEIPDELKSTVKEAKKDKEAFIKSVVKAWKKQSK